MIMWMQRMRKITTQVFASMMDVVVDHSANAVNLLINVAHEVLTLAAGQRTCLSMISSLTKLCYNKAGHVRAERYVTLKMPTSLVA